MRSHGAVKIATKAEEHQRFIFKVTHLMGVLGFGTFCYLLGARPQDVPYVYCLFYVIFVPLRWIYYRYKKWHYYLLDFCYYANTFLLVMILFYPKDEKLFMVCFSFAEGPLAWALIVWRCSLVFSSFDKLVSVLIHLLPAAYTLWQLMYFLIVNVLRRQRLLRDPEVMTSYRELSKKAQKANNIWWRLSGLLGDKNRPLMYILLQAVFTVATLAFTVPIFLSYRLHGIFQVLKVCAATWNGGSFILEVMPRQVVQKEKKRLEMKPIEQANLKEHMDDRSGNHQHTSEEQSQ
uniref:Glycerophosphocholine acyltransferase 1 n=1 Tax=Aegilops tauschii TaxID=37682 RepID=M8CBS5_AEGTA